MGNFTHFLPGKKWVKKVESIVIVGNAGEDGLVLIFGGMGYFCSGGRVMRSFGSILPEPSTTIASAAS